MEIQSLLVVLALLQRRLTRLLPMVCLSPCQSRRLLTRSVPLVQVLLQRRLTRVVPLVCLSLLQSQRLLTSLVPLVQLQVSLQEFP